MRKVYLIIFSFLILIPCISGQEAYIFKDIYKINIDVDGTDKESISHGMKEALKIVIINVSGSSEILTNKTIMKALPKPEVFISEYKHNFQEGGRITGVFSFNGKEVRKFLSDNGLPLWVGLTHDILVYFPCRYNLSSPNPVLHKDRCNDLITKTKSITSLRVLNIVEPGMDLDDLETVEIFKSKSDELVLTNIARRYGLNHWLACFIYDSLGVLFDNPNCISSEFYGSQLPLEKSISFLADSLNKEYQLVIDPNSKSSSLLTITGIKDHLSLNLIKEIIDSQTLVVNSRIISIEGSKVIFFIDLIGKPTDLQKIMNVNTSFFLNANSQIEDESISYSYIGEN